MNPLVPVPPHLMGMLMNLVQSQMPMQGQVQQVGAAPMQAYSQMQLPAGVGPVGAGWQGQWQPMQPAAMPQQQVMQDQPMQAAARQVSMDDLQAAVTAAMQQQERGASGAPVGSHRDDERTLVDAMKKGRASGAKPRHILEKLHKVNGHTDIEWKNYFLEHLERLYPMIYERGLSSSRDQKDTPLSHTKASDSASANGKTRQAPGRRERTPVPPSRSPSLQHISVSFRSTKAVPPHKPSASMTGSAHLKKKGELISEHAGVQIPPLPPGVKPKPPPKPPVSQGTGKFGKFTKEEKIFFIQYLRWRLERDGPIPSQRKLCLALSREAPQRTPDGWKNHWDIYPELPERIVKLAEAKHRAAARTSGRPAPTVEDEEGEEDEDEEQDEDGAYEGEAADDSYASEDATTSVPRKRKRRKGAVTPRKVTAEDIRDMANYKLGRLHEWDELKTQKARWEDFTAKHTKRSFAAWTFIATYRADEIDEVLQELLEEQKADQTTQVHAAPPVRNAASSSASGRNSVNGEQTTSSLHKHESDSRLAVRSGSPVAKRIKQEPVEYISLLSDDD